MNRFTCLNCNTDISNKRKTAKFCSENCRKDKFQRGERQYSKVNAASSPTERRSQKDLFDSHHRMSEVYYNSAPDKRPAILISIIRYARLGDPKSKRVLCNQVFLKANPRKDKHKCWRRLPTIAQAAHKLCMGAVNVGIEKVVTGDPSHFAELEAINLKSLTVSFNDNSPPPMPSNGTIVLPTDLTLSPMALLAYQLACASAGVTVVRTNKSRANFSGERLL